MKYMASCSCGKDSVAMIEKLIEIGWPLDEIVFAKVEKSFDEELIFMDKLIKRYEGLDFKCIVLECDTTWDEWFYGKSTRGKTKGLKRGFPFKEVSCWWTREAKVKILNKYMGDNFRYIGYAIDEPSSTRKAKINKYIKNGYIDVDNPKYIYPLVNLSMTESDCMEVCRELNILNPLYKFFDRLGCYLCPKMSIKNLISLCENFPAEWDELVKYAKSTKDDSFINPGLFTTVGGLKKIRYNVLKKIEKKYKNK